MSKSTKFFGVLLSVLLVFTSLVFAAPSAGASHFMYEDGWYFQDGTALRKKTYDYLELEVGETMSFYLEHKYVSIEKNEWGTTDHSVVKLDYIGYTGQNRCDLTALKTGECRVTGWVRSYVKGEEIGENANGFPKYSEPIYDNSIDQFFIRVVKSRSSRSTSNSTAKKPASTAAKKTVTLKTPQITKIENLASGQKVTWGKVSGAAKYRVFYKKGSKWAKLIDTTATSVVNKIAKSGKKYVYTVRCLSKDGKKYTSGVNSTGKGALFIGTPKITKIENYVSGQGVSWGKIAGAPKYRVFYKKDSKWVKLCDTTATSVVNKIAKPGKKYIYTVRCISKDGKRAVGAMDNTGKSAVFVAAPKISSFMNSQIAVTITWSKSAGASKYRLFFKSGGEWKPLATVAGTAYTHKVANGNKYTYTVRCMNSAGKYNSGFNRNGWSHKAPVAPYMLLSKTSVSLAWQEAEFMEVRINGKIVDNSTLKWTSSNTDVATVTRDGVIWAEGKGTAIVTVTAPNGKTATVTVKVRNNLIVG